MTVLWRASKFLLCALLVVLVFRIPTFSQTETATISGTITDQSGATVSGADVTLVNVLTGITAKTKSNEAGLYVFSSVRPSQYRMTVEKPGFRQVVLTDLTVNVQDTLSRNFSLQLGVVGESVTVTADAVKVNTASAEVSSVVTATEVGQLPTLTRNPYDLVATAANAQQDSEAGVGDARGVGYSLNGQRSASTDVLLDGAENMDLNLALVGQTVPLDSVQEFRIITNGMSAEFGRASGGVVNVATKSGTNALHGGAYEYNRISALASNTYNNAAFGEPRGIFTRNQFGFSLGGPIKKNKLFFFNNTEWIRVRSGAPWLTIVPDSGLIGAANSATQTFFSTYGKLRPDLKDVNTISVSQLNGYGITPGPLLTAYGGPNCTAEDGYANCPNPAFDTVSYNLPADAGGGSPQNTLMTLGRVDFNITDKTQLSARYSYYGETDLAGTISTSPYVGYETGQTNKDNTFLLSLTHSFTSSLLSSTRLSFSRLNSMQPLGTNPASPTLFVSNAIGARINGTLIALPGYGEYLTYGSFPYGGPQNFIQLSDDLSWVHRKHTFRFGGQYIYTQSNKTVGAYEEPMESLSAGVSETDAFENLLAGQINSFQGAVSPQGKYPCLHDPATGALIPSPSCTVTLPVGPPSFSRSDIYNDLAFYGQDSWKVTPRLTLNLGLRWEYYGVQHNKNQNLDANFYPGSGSTIFDQLRAGSVQPALHSPVDGLWQPQRHNFGPRIGFAYDILGDGKTSLRGGYGISYERNYGQITFNVIQNPPNYGVLSVDAADLGLPYLPVYTDNSGPFSGSSGTQLLGPVSLRDVNDKIKTAYAEQWNLGVERALARNLVADIGYSGARGIHQYSETNINEPGFAQLYLGDTSPNYRINTQYSNINARESDGDLYYHAMVATLRGKLKSVQFNGNYTWSHSIDTLSSTTSDEIAGNDLGYIDPFNTRLDRASSDYDARHRVVLSAVVPLSFYKNSSNKFLQNAVSGWEFAPIYNYHSGNPFTVFDCMYTASIYNCPRAFMIPGQSVPKSGSVGAYHGGNSFNYMSVPASVSTDGGVTPGANEYTGPATITGTSTPFPFAASNLPTCAGLEGQGCTFPPNMLGRNSFVGPGNWNLNFGIYKNFAVTERLNLQFRGEFYDLTNHKNYYLLAFQEGGAEVNSLPPDANGYPIVQAKKGGFGNTYDDHRNVQLALKLTF